MAKNFALSRLALAITGSILAFVTASPAADEVPAPARWSIEIVSGVVAGAPSTLRFVVEARRDLAAGDVVEIFPPLCAPFAAAQWSAPHLAEEDGAVATGPGRVVSDDPVRLSTIPWPAEPLCHEIRGKLERLPLGIRAELTAPLRAGRRLEILYGDPGPAGDGRAVA
ncbi:MAG: hypothetical protein KC591_04110, partial [Gemmatimonadetes bacterium]|nr:hypothetical protein [Gemmatimonadota bacterium]